ncbi:hypothetical protein PoB_007664400 [Plakobranchus ocellatus]|uniref:Uncharacterized protein n=1 Tax=Plakobranchus ocellatus TaxID=259542 RepID=A0AAV4E0W0_9GAST|nr:hypothetical protein PoB_007664400 [Plakobranchus ocellatus]
MSVPISQAASALKLSREIITVHPDGRTQWGTCPNSQGSSTFYYLIAIQAHGESLVHLNVIDQNERSRKKREKKPSVTASSRCFTNHYGMMAMS